MVEKIIYTHCRKCGREINAVDNWQDAICSDINCIKEHETQMEEIRKGIRV